MFVLFLFLNILLMFVFFSYVLSLICEAVLCLELVLAELGQAHYKYIKNIIITTKVSSPLVHNTALWL